MRYAGVITMKEQYEVWIYLTEYLHLVFQELPEQITKLLTEFYKYTLFTLKYAMPPLMPSEAIELVPDEWEGVNENIPSLYFPMEDIREGRSKSGQIGQELYGSGGPITFAVQAYLELSPEITVYSEYPIINYNGLTFTLGGVPDYHCWVEIFADDVINILNEKDEQMELKQTEKGGYKFWARGGQTYKIVIEH